MNLERKWVIVCSRGFNKKYFLFEFNVEGYNFYWNLENFKISMYVKYGFKYKLIDWVSLNFWIILFYFIFLVLKVLFFMI